MKRYSLELNEEQLFDFMALVKGTLLRTINNPMMDIGIKEELLASYWSLNSIIDNAKDLGDIK